MKALQKEFENRFPKIRSEKQNGSGFWLENCHWDVRHDETAVRNHNLIRALNLSKAQGMPLLVEAAENLLDDLRAKAKAAAAAKWLTDKDRKVFHTL